MHFYGLIIGISLAIGINYFLNSPKIIPKNKQNLFIIGTLIFSIIGARLYHVIDFWSYYSQNLLQIPQTWSGGLGIFGGLLGGLIFIFLFCQFNKLNFLSVLNLIAPILPLCQYIGRLGNFINQEISIWWLESLLCLVLFFIIKRFPSNPTAKYLLGYGLIRLTTEFFRTDTWTINTTKIGQIISIVFIILGLILMFRQNLYNKPYNQNQKDHS
jgi:phosphatidylglycerol:prolipoprotein diacylglycerol transferase